MASSTGIPQNNPGLSEQEPLLGRPGDASQADKPLYYNFAIGTATVAQAGIWVLTAIVWGAVFSNELIFFSAHPLLNSAAILFLVQGILVLQPTHTATQKRNGTYVHAGLNDVALAAAIAGLVIIEINKGDHGHFESPHAILGLITYIFLAIQAFVGITQYFVPQIYGGVSNAKKLYKYHRASGYVILVLALATICAATETGFNKNVLGIQLWAVIVASVITVLGVFARIKKQKLGF
ncbi:MAG: hypothetical protein M1820_009350 [Bogoriella megaspora]|nr:MAG: hypothetical protein M1820_009350 [Bogoriella megaspora]